MEEYADQIRSYLPISFRDPDNEEYINYLISAYLNNISGESYQFAFIAFHLLYMSYIYKAVWLLKENNVFGISQIIERHPHIVNGSSPFNLSTLGEKKIIRQAIQLLGFHLNQVNDFCSVIEKRDHCAHASGVIQYKQGHVETHIKNELEYIEKIQKKLELYLGKIYIKFSQDNCDPNNREYSLTTDAIDDFIKDFLLSPKDIELMTNIKFPELIKPSKSKKIIDIKLSYLVFLLKSCDILGFDYSLPIENIPILVKGLDKKIKDYLKTRINDEFQFWLKDISDSDKKVVAPKIKPDFIIKDSVGGTVSIEIKS